MNVTPGKPRRRALDLLKAMFGCAAVALAVKATATIAPVVADSTISPALLPNSFGTANAGSAPVMTVAWNSSALMRPLHAEFGREFFGHMMTARPLCLLVSFLQSKHIDTRQQLSVCKRARG